MIATAITLPIKADAGRRSASYVFTWVPSLEAKCKQLILQRVRFVRHRLAYWMGEFLTALSLDDAKIKSFVLGLIQGAYCLSPTGMLASMAEEVKRPEMAIPRAMSVLLFHL